MTDSRTARLNVPLTRLAISVGLFMVWLFFLVGVFSASPVSYLCFWRASCPRADVWRDRQTIRFPVHTLPIGISGRHAESPEWAGIRSIACMRRQSNCFLLAFSFLMRRFIHPCWCGFEIGCRNDVVRIYRVAFNRLHKECLQRISALNPLLSPYASLIILP